MERPPIFLGRGHGRFQRGWWGGATVRLKQAIVGSVVVAVGIGMLSGALTIFSLGRASDGDKLIGLVEGELTDQGLSDHQSDLATWDRGAVQLQKETVPWLAQRAGVDPSAFAADLGQQVPEVAAATSSLPGGLPFAHK